MRSAAEDFAQKASLSSFVQSPFSARLRERAIAFSAPSIARFTDCGKRGVPKSAAMRRCSDSGKIESGYVSPRGGFVETALPSASGVGSNALGRAGSTIPPQGETYPLSIFPESEQRRIAVDFGTPRLPPAVKRAIAGAEKAMARSRKRAEKGLCTKEECEAFCAKSSSALRAYLDKQVESGVLTPAERKAIGR